MRMNNRSRLCLFLVVTILAFIVVSPSVLAKDVQALDVPTYVNNLYVRYLGRAAGAAEQTAWVNAINTGVLNRTQVAYAIINSTEFHTPFVQFFYAICLGRAPSGAELAAWVNAMSTSLTDDQFMAVVVASEECRIHVGSTNESFVATLYGWFLGRAAVGTEDDGWINALNGDALSRTTVALAFAGCRESHIYRPHSYYQSILSRAASAGEEYAWANAMDAGLSIEMLQAAIIGSQEYFTNATPL